MDSLVASVKPRPVPAEGVRKLPEPRRAAAAVAAPPSAGPERLPPPSTTVPAAPQGAGEPGAPLGSAPVVAVAVAPPHRDAPAAEMRAVSEGRWSLRVTIDRAFKEDLETLAMLLSHKVPRGDLSAVLREAIRSGIEKHGKRKGAVAPARKRSPPPEAPGRDPRAIPIEVRRQVWKRDGGCCTWTAPDGRRCGSRWQLELDHIVPPLLGGSSTVGELRLRCKQHNLLYAEQIYGREHMDRFRRDHAPNG